MSEPILEVKNLVKNFGPFRALDGISFEIPKGKVIGLLGPNGAGKTTTINILLGITLSNGGTIRYFGKDFFNHSEYCLQKINFASSFNTLQGRISVWENLLVFSYLYSLKSPEKKIRGLAEMFEITDLLSKRFWDLSTGQKTRVNLIKSMINDPDIILMDEVTRICDEVIFLDGGKIVAHDTPLGLTKRIKTVQLKLIFEGDGNTVKNYLEKENKDFSFLQNYVVLIKTEEKLVPKLIFEINKLGIWITDIDTKKPNLEDVFLQIARRNKNVA